MKSNQVDIAQILCSRLCHDIIAPISAINSGLELLSDSPGHDQDEVLKLINMGAQSATAKLTLYRFAFGATAGSQISSLQDAVPLIHQTVNLDKFKINTDLSTPINIAEDVVAQWAQLILQTTMILAESAPYGGEIHISTSAKNSVLLKLISDNIILNQENYDIMILGCERKQLSARNIIPYVINSSLNQLRVSMIKEKSDRELVFQIMS